jgi:hypothetical protein
LTSDILAGLDESIVTQILNIVLDRGFHAKVQSAHVRAESVNSFCSTQAHVQGHLAVKLGLHPPS